MTSKELPRVEPMRPQPRQSVLTTIEREIQKAEEIKQRGAASGFLDKFLRLFSDYSHHSGRSHKRKLGAVSTRSPEEIIAELRAFQRQRPRPWRPAGNRPRRAGKGRDVRRMHLQGAAKFVRWGDRDIKSFRGSVVAKIRRLIARD